ncbi:MAG: energy-coupling factor transporter transmembrane component T [Eubacteriales bacterium]|nr:energy-coupling factor transporter transmembrane component T [Eubacteriales bacterium]
MDVKIGQYWPGDSLIHRLDARTKLIALIILLVSLLSVKDPISIALFTVLSLALIKFAGIPFKVVLRSFKNVIFIVAFAFFMNLFFRAEGEEIIWRFGFLKISKEGLAAAFLMSIRILLLVFNSTFFLSLTTRARALADALEKLLKPLRYIKVPVSELALMMSIALRFIPTLIDESDRIIKAQASRGGDLDRGGLFKKAKAFVIILVPLFVSALKRAGDLALAMEVRCYRGGVGRTSLIESKMKRQDYLFIAFTLLLALVLIGQAKIRL